MTNLNLIQDVANKKKENSGQILFPIGMHRDGSLINIKPSVEGKYE